MFSLHVKPEYCTCSFVSRISVDNSCIFSCVQSSEISWESNSPSISAAKFASSGAPPGTEVFLECCIYLCYIYGVLSSEFLLFDFTESR